MKKRDLCAKSAAYTRKSIFQVQKSLFHQLYLTDRHEKCFDCIIKIIVGWLCIGHLVIDHGASILWRQNKVVPEQNETKFPCGEY